MRISFKSQALEELFLYGKTNTKPYHRIPISIVKQYIKVVNYIRAARRIEDLYVIKSLHYEKKIGNLQNVDVVWINQQYRLLFHGMADEGGIVVEALLFEISKHYE